MTLALITIFAIGVTTILILAGIGMQDNPKFRIVGMEGSVLIECKCKELVYVDDDRIATCPKCGRKYDLSMTAREVDQ